MEVKRLLLPRRLEVQSGRRQVLNAKTHEEEPGSAGEHGSIACKAPNSVEFSPQHRKSCLRTAEAREGHCLLTSPIHRGLVGRMEEVGNAKTLW